MTTSDQERAKAMAKRIERGEIKTLSFNDKTDYGRELALALESRGYKRAGGGEGAKSTFNLE
jgi:hypothetical protein